MKLKCPSLARSEDEIVAFLKYTGRHAADGRVDRIALRDSENPRDQGRQADSVRRQVCPWPCRAGPGRAET